MFTERLHGLVAPWARRTQLLVHWLVHIVLALAGTVGARLSRDLGPAITRTTSRSPRMFPSWSASGRHDQWRVRSRPCSGLRKGCATTTTPSKLGSPCPGVMAEWRAPSIA